MYIGVGYNDDMTHIYRRADALIEALVLEEPGVMVLGPRATGKTTSASRFARTIVRLDEPARAAAFRADPDAALRGLDEPVLLDEWQEAPGVLGAVKRSIDADPRPGRFILTGSAMGATAQQMWPGTGRLVNVLMQGLSVAEVAGVASGPTLIDRLRLGEEPVPAQDSPDLRGYVDLALRGGFPELVARPRSVRSSRAWLTSYVAQIVGRDAGALEDRDSLRLQRFFEAFALNTAGMPSDVTLGEAAGVDRRTARAYEHLLERLFVIDAVPAWRSNRLKRLVARPKRFLVDPALLVGLFGVDTDAVLADGDLLGRVIETFVMAQLRVEAASADARIRMHHLRAEGGAREVDIIAEVGARELVAFEVKATSAPTVADARHLIWLMQNIEHVRSAVVFHTGPSTFKLTPSIWAAPISSLWGPPAT